MKFIPKFHLHVFSLYLCSSIWVSLGLFKVFFPSPIAISTLVLEGVARLGLISIEIAIAFFLLFEPTRWIARLFGLILASSFLFFTLSGNTSSCGCLGSISISSPLKLGLIGLIFLLHGIELATKKIGAEKNTVEV